MRKFNKRRHHKVQFTSNEMKNKKRGKNAEEIYVSKREKSFLNNE